MHALATPQARHWGRLIGAEVEIHRGRQLVRAGAIDDVMPDPSVLLRK
jgi:hypothetical protein